MEGGAEVLENTSAAAVAEIEAPHRVSRLGVLRHRHYRNVWFGALTSNIGGWMEHTGIQWVMTTETLKPEWKESGLPAAPIMLGVLAAFQLGPMLLLGIPGGVMADRVDRKKLLMVTQTILMVIVLVLTTLSFTGHLTPWAMMAIGLANGVTMAFNMPAWQVLTPRLVPREELARAITMNGIAFNMARVAGPALAAMILSISQPSTLFVINAMSFIAVIVAVAGTPPAPAPPRDGSHAWQQTSEAMGFVFKRKGPLRIFLVMVLFSMLGAPLTRMPAIFAAEVYHTNTDRVASFFHLKDADMFGVMLSMMGIGAVIGGVALRRVPSWYPKHHFIPLSVMMGGLSIATWSMLTSVGAAAIAMLFCGVFWLWSFNTATAAMQLLVDDRMRGRVLAVCNTAIFGAMALGSVGGGYLGHMISDHEGTAAQYGVGIPATVLALAGLVMLIWRTPEIDDIKPGEVGYERRPGFLRGVTGAAHRPVKQRM